MKVRLILYDDMSDPTTTKALYEKLITVDKVDFILGPYSSSCSLSMSPVAEKYKKVAIHPLSTADNLYNQGWAYQFLAKLAGTNSMEDIEFFEFLKSLPEDIKPKTIGIISVADYYPRSRRDAITALAPIYGFKITFSEEIPKDTTDVSGVITKIKVANPEVFVPIGFLPMETLLVRTASELGYKPKLIYAATSNIPEFWDNLKEKAQGVIISLDYHTSLKFKEAQDFAQLYQAEYGKPPVGHYAALGFAACQMLEAAIKATNSLDNDIIREWLINNKVNTCVGTWEVDKDLMNKGVKYVPKYFHFVTQWQNGTMQIVYPPELATSSYIYPIP